MRWTSGVVIAAFAGGSIGFASFAEAAWPPKWFGKTSTNHSVGGRVSAQTIGPAQIGTYNESTSDFVPLSRAADAGREALNCDNSLVASSSANSNGSTYSVRQLPDTSSSLFYAGVTAAAGFSGSADNWPCEIGGTPACPGPLYIYPNSSFFGSALSTIEFELLRPADLALAQYRVEGTELVWLGNASPQLVAKVKLTGPSGVLHESSVSLPTPGGYISLPSPGGLFRVPPGTYKLTAETHGSGVGTTGPGGITQSVGFFSNAEFGVGLSPVLCPESEGQPTEIFWPANQPGGTISFGVAWRANNVASVTHQWYRNGVPLSDIAIPDGPTITGSTSTVLQIDNATPAYAGVYTCILTCSDGCDPVTILGGTFRTEGAACATEPEVSTLSSASTSSCVGGQLSMSVDTTNTQSIQWLRNGGVLSDGPTLDGAIISGSNTGTLTITGAKETDSGSYGILATGPCSSRVFNSLFTATVAASCCPADLNGDNSVDDADFVLFVNAYNILDCADPTMPAGCAADFNTDKVVDDSDFVIFVPAYNQLLCD